MASRAPSIFGSPGESRRASVSSASSSSDGKDGFEKTTPVSTLAPTFDSVSLPSPEADDAAPAHHTASSPPGKGLDGLRSRLLPRGSFSTLSYPYGGGASLRRMPLLLHFPEEQDSASGAPVRFRRGCGSDDDEYASIEPGDEEDDEEGKEGGKEGPGGRFSLALKREKRTGETSDIASSWAPVPFGAALSASSPDPLASPFSRPANLGFGPGLGLGLGLGMGHVLGSGLGLQGLEDRRQVQVVGKEDDSLGEYWIEEHEHELHDHLSSRYLDDTVPHLPYTADPHPHAQPHHRLSHHQHVDFDLSGPDSPRSAPPAGCWEVPPPVADECAIGTVWRLVSLEKEERMRREAEMEDEFAGQDEEEDGN